MTDREELRRRMELAGYDQATMPAFENLGQTLDYLEALMSLLRQFTGEAAQSLAELFEAATDAQQAAGPAKLPRPPRDTRPKNMAAYRTLRPARVARSSCRKIHR